VKAAAMPRPAGAERLLRVDPTRGAYFHHRIDELPALLAPGDLLVVNDAATLPASLRIVGRDAEVRLVQRRESDSAWTAVLFGKGDFRTPTEERPEPPRVRCGERLELEGGIVAHVFQCLPPGCTLLVDLRFPLSGADLFQALYRGARPVQYAYLARELELWDFQNRFAARPWALEMPSAGHVLTWELLLALRARGVGLAHVTHAAGISSTGSIRLDRRFPLPERYEIGDSAVQRVRETKKKEGRVIAVGTTVVRALEASHAEHGQAYGGTRRSPGSSSVPAFDRGSWTASSPGCTRTGRAISALLEGFASATLLRARSTPPKARGTCSTSSATRRSCSAREDDHGSRRPIAARTCKLCIARPVRGSWPSGSNATSLESGDRASSLSTVDPATGKGGQRGALAEPSAGSCKPSVASV
jgi:S-adenosylmethionine:tRNA ribosyltransferase-isomerase